MTETAACPLCSRPIDDPQTCQDCGKVTCTDCAMYSEDGEQVWCDGCGEALMDAQDQDQARTQALLAFHAPKSREVIDLEVGAALDIAYQAVGCVEVGEVCWDQNLDFTLATLGAAVVTLRARAEAAEAKLAVPEDEWASVPADLAEVVNLIGPAEWAVTAPADADGHGRNVARSVRLTAEEFGQGNELQPMQMLCCQGTDTVIGYLGTSPNSARIARAMTGAWNLLHQHCAARAGEAAQ